MAERRPERRHPPRPGSTPTRRRRFPSVSLALAGGALCTVGAVVAVWLALREPADATPLGPARPPAAVRGHTAFGPPGPLAAPPDAAGAAATDDDSSDDPVVPSDSGGLSRADVVSAINAVRPQLQRCARDPSLIGVVRMTVSSSGKVTSAQVFGGLAGTSAGECVAEVARGASFRPSRREQTVVSWPVSMGRTGSSIDVTEQDVP